MPFYPASSVTAPQRQATTGLAGFALQNGTPQILTWTAPNDGAMHRYQIFAALNVASLMTGGETALVFTPPAGGQQTQQFSGAGLAAGFYGPGSFAFLTGVVGPGTVITLEQFTALTAGAASLFAELWAS